MVAVLNLFSQRVRDVCRRVLDCTVKSRVVHFKSCIAGSDVHSCDVDGMTSYIVEKTIEKPRYLTCGNPWVPGEPFQFAVYNLGKQVETWRDVYFGSSPERRLMFHSFCS